MIILLANILLLLIVGALMYTAGWDNTPKRKGKKQTYDDEEEWPSPPIGEIGRLDNLIRTDRNGETDWTAVKAHYVSRSRPGVNVDKRYDVVTEPVWTIQQKQANLDKKKAEAVALARKQ